MTTNKAILAALLAAPAMLAVAAPAQAQVAGIAYANPTSVVASSKAFAAANQQISTTYKAAFDQMQQRRQQLDFVLWEHADATDAHGHPAAAAELRMVLLTVLGVSGDLAWRRGVRRGAAPWLFPAPVQLVPNRLKRRLWVPLHRGHVFDQTNGLFAHPEPGGAAVIFD